MFKKSYTFFFLSCITVYLATFAVVYNAKAQYTTLTALTVTPRANFTPTPPDLKGFWNIDVVGDFYIPTSKSMTFMAAGRNLHVQQDREKLFRRGFTALERTRMTNDEQHIPIFNEKPAGWKSPLTQSQRALVLSQNYFYYPPSNEFNLLWAKESTYAPYTYFLRPLNDPFYKNSLGAAVYHLGEGCLTFGDCPTGKYINTYGRVFYDIENEGTPDDNQQQQINLYVYMMQALREVSTPATEIGSIGPIPHNSFGFTRETDLTAKPDWLWANPALHTEAQLNKAIYSSKDRGMPDVIVGKSFADYADYQMPGVYYVSQAFSYTAAHTGDYEPHWLGSLLHEQEVNLALSPKKRIAWQWMFNTQSYDLPGNSSRAENPAPPAIAEGTAIFYWFTGADGVLFWDDANNLTPNRNTLPDNDPNKGLESDRNYACYEHYLHGLWRIFHHHADLFNGNEVYLNQQTECSFDKGQTWHKYNARDLKRLGLPFARAIVNGDQILIAASMPYAFPGQQTSMQVRYSNGRYKIATEINLTGDEVFLGRATMTSYREFPIALCNGCK
jgi:hypothetical protein